VGNARLVATTLKDTAQQLQRELSSGKMSRTQLQGAIESVSSGADLIDRSLERAADLVQSFKQVAVDQTSNRRRSFAVQDVIHENQVLLAPRLRGAGAVVQVVAPGDKLFMSSYPGALGQVVTNLIENALVHAYGDQGGGRIDVVVEPVPDDAVQVQVRDYGRGIPPESLAKVFDPFFTTRLGQGGSGLGLSIVYGLVTRTLGGRVSVDSVPGQGATFTLVLPVNGPTHADEASAHSAQPGPAA
jgi:signal transduction histidine kinase